MVITRSLVTTLIGHVHMYRCNSELVSLYVGVNHSPIVYFYVKQKTESC